jgi:3-dehydroquinate synthase
MKETVYFGSIVNSGFEDLLLNKYGSSRKVIMVDENTHDHCLEYLLTSFPSLSEAEVMLLPAGEENKVMEVCFQVWNALSEYEISRHDLVMNLGGGMVTDMGGFIASIYKRGVDFIHIPTSLLGMVDASIGGKTGIDLGPYKNQLGVFSQAQAIFIDPVFLSTLPEDEIWNGYAEMLKHALISDEILWEKLVPIKSVEELVGLELIQQCAEIKLGIVQKDPLEKNERKLLNLGHTVGHAIEGYLLSKETPIAHGHAVAIGILIEAMIANRIGALDGSDYAKIEKAIKDHFARIGFESEEEIESVVSLMRNDKKNSEGLIKGILIHKIGKCETDFVYQEDLVISCLRTFLS